MEITAISLGMEQLQGLQQLYNPSAPSCRYGTDIYAALVHYVERVSRNTLRKHKQTYMAVVFQMYVFAVLSTALRKLGAKNLVNSVRDFYVSVMV